MSTLLMVASTALSQPAQATPWDGQWLSVGLSVTLPAHKGFVYGATPMDHTLTKTAKKYNGSLCFMHLTDGNPGVFGAKVFCSPSDGVWEFVTEHEFYFAGASNVIGQDNPVIYTPVSGQSVTADPKTLLKYEGTFILNAKIVKDVIKTVTFSASQGMFFVDDQPNATFGSTRSGTLKIKLPKTGDITPELLACQAAADGTGYVENCGGTPPD